MKSTKLEFNSLGKGKDPESRFLSVLVGLEDVSSNEEDDNYEADSTDGETALPGIQTGKSPTRKEIVLDNSEPLPLMEGEGGLSGYGVPKEGLRIQDVLIRIAELMLIKEKIDYASENPGSPLFPEDIVSRFPGLRSGRHWKEEHDLLLLGAVLKHGYGRWQAIVDDRDLKFQELICQELKLPVINISMSEVVPGGIKFHWNSFEEPEVEPKVEDTPNQSFINNDACAPDQWPEVVAINPMEVSTACDNDPNRAELLRLYNRMCKVLEENVQELIQTSAASNPASLKLRKNLLPLESILTDINGILSPEESNSGMLKNPNGSTSQQAEDAAAAQAGSSTNQDGGNASIGEVDAVMQDTLVDKVSKGAVDVTLMSVPEVEMQDAFAPVSDQNLIRLLKAWNE
ncbi:hypothetical protein MLD38_013981 [Melastoma candidum]|uniref:Uncharacterized protein n=1 Tax=Melastoma candidum TaxID=119954 RepID=A0ACB9REF1_9MYRT|nr:hypothetical protein MLD38_013981 [Melastoma candidum]